MGNQKITVHCLIKNEEQWVWYALMSVVDYVDEIVVYDTGSTDKTVEIVKSIKSPKIIFKEQGVVDAKEYTNLRQEMIDKTDGGWILILDGDEIWTDETAQEMRQAVESANDGTIAVALQYWNCLGDVFHYDREFEKKKCPFGPENLSGWWTIHCFRKNIPGLHVTGLYGFEGFADGDGKQLFESSTGKIHFLQNRFFHMTFLFRSPYDSTVMQRAKKRRYELGKPFPEEILYPKVFDYKKPDIVPSAYRNFSLLDRIKGFFIIPWVRLRTFFWKKLVYPRIERAKQENISDEELARLVGIKRK